MTGFDLGPIKGFDLGMPQGGPLQGPAQESLQGLEGFQGPAIPNGEGFDTRVDVSGGGRAKPFAGVLADSLDHVKGLQDDVRYKVRGLVMGEDVELHDVLIAGSKSEVAFNLLLEVRNKMVDAWEKLSRSVG